MLGDCTILVAKTKALISFAVMLGLKSHRFMAPLLLPRIEVVEDESHLAYSEKNL